MGKQIHLNKVQSLFDRSNIVDFKSIKRIVGGSYAKLLVHNLIKKGIIHKIGNGFYTKSNEISLAVLSFKPAYLGLQTALSHHNVWEQETIPVIITTKNVRRGLRSLIGGNVLIRRINKKYFFGINYVNDGGFYLPYSDLEKTLIDMVSFNQKIDKEHLKNLVGKIDNKKLQDYLNKYPPKIRHRVASLLENVI